MENNYIIEYYIIKFHTQSKYINFNNKRNLNTIVENGKKKL